MSRFCAQCEAHRVEIERLKEEVAAWKVYAAGGDFENQRRAYGLAFRMSPAEAGVLVHLVQRAGVVVTRDSLLESSRTASSHKASEDVGGNLVSVYISHLRMKLLRVLPDGVDIQSKWGAGYLISSASAKRIREYVEATS